MKVQCQREHAGHEAVMQECRDEDFAGLLARCADAGEQVLVIANRHTAALLSRSFASLPWCLRGLGEFGALSLNARVPVLFVLNLAVTPKTAQPRGFKPF